LSLEIGIPSIGAHRIERRTLPRLIEVSVNVGAPAVRVTYLVRCGAREVEARAESLLLEQTVELPRSSLREPEAVERVLGRVEVVEARPGGGFRVIISHPLLTTAHDPAQLLNVVFGNSSLHPDVVLADVELPDAAFDWLPGPRAGITGLRALTGVEGRPLVASALKPMGLDPKQLGVLCRTFAAAGLDLVKDDHGLADHSFCPFEARLETCLRATEGSRTLYVPNLIGTPERVLAQLAAAREAGAKAVMISPMIVGLPLLHQLAGMPEGLPILAHPSLAGLGRAEVPVLLGKLFRWYGANAVIFPHAGGRFTFETETCRDLAAALRAPRAHLRPSFPVPAGGLGVGQVEEVQALYGRDSILLIGGALYQAGHELYERTRALVARVARAAAAEPI
jgi:ribulose-bisphosphate carboxylase large chain